MIETDALFQIGHLAEERGDFGRARECFERCAAFGSVEAINRLAYLFDVGLGVAVDKDRALQLYRRAWRAGSSAAATNIAILHRERSQHRLEVRWFAKAAEAGDGSAHLELAKSYLAGRGVRRSPQNAVHSLRAALTSDSVSEEEREEAEQLLQELRPLLA